MDRGVDEKWMGWHSAGLGVASCEAVLWSAIRALMLEERVPATS